MVLLLPLCFACFHVAMRRQLISSGSRLSYFKIAFQNTKEVDASETPDRAGPFSDEEFLRQAEGEAV